MPKIFYFFRYIHKNLILHKNLQSLRPNLTILSMVQWSCKEALHAWNRVARSNYTRYVLYLRHIAVDQNLIVHRATKPLLLLPFESRSSPDFVISICVKVRARKTEDKTEEEWRESSYARVCIHHVRENAHRWRWSIVNDDLVVH